MNAVRSTACDICIDEYVYAADTCITHVLTVETKEIICVRGAQYYRIFHLGSCLVPGSVGFVGPIVLAAQQKSVVVLAARRKNESLQVFLFRRPVHISALCPNV